MKVPLSILICLWGGRLVDLLLREQPFTIIVYERMIDVRILNTEQITWASKRGWKREIYSRYSSQDTCSCHYKSEPSLGGGPKGPTRSFNTRLSFSASDNVTLFSIKAALWKITVSPLNPIDWLWFVYQGCAALRIELRLPFKFLGRMPTWCRIQSAI